MLTETKRFETMLKVSADSPEKMSAHSFERYLEECEGAGLDLERAKDYILSFESLNPYTRGRVEAIYAQFVGGE